MTPIEQQLYRRLLNTTEVFSLAILLLRPEDYEVKNRLMAELSENKKLLNELEFA